MSNARRWGQRTRALLLTEVCSWEDNVDGPRRDAEDASPFSADAIWWSHFRKSLAETFREACLLCLQREQPQICPQALDF